MTIVKDATDLETWWVAPVYGSKVFPRVRVDVLLADCETVKSTGCAVTGTLIWQEDFDRYGDGLNPASPLYSIEELPVGMTTYAFNSTNPIILEGYYSLAKHGSPQWGSVCTDDHTSPTSPDVGRFLLTNGKSTADMVYQQTINGLCANTEMYLSFWMNGVGGKVVWTVYSTQSNNVLATFGPLTCSDWGTWKPYGFPFTLPAGETSVRFEIYNNDVVAGGNDIGYDDIAVYICVPEVTLTQPAATDMTVCEGTALAFAGGYTDDNTFGQTLDYRWEYSATGDLTNQSSWHPVSGTEGSVTNGVVSSNYSIAALTTAETGYYRLLVANPANIDNVNCRAMSDVVHVQVDSLPAAPAISPVTACTGGELVFSIPALYSAYEWRADNSAGAAAGNTAYITATGVGTHTRVVRVQNDFGCWSPYSAPASGTITAPTSSSSITVTGISSDYIASPPTVTFSVSWAADTRNCRHNSDVWVFIDYQPIVGGSPGAWSRAFVDVTPTVVNGTASMAGSNNKGFWLHGATSGSYSATITVPVTTSGSTFSWCAYAMDYPPNATENAAGYYTLHGTPPFTVNGSQLAAGATTFTGCITSLADSTACPALLPTQPQIVSLTADIPTIYAGDSTTLRAIATRAAQYSFDNGATWTTSATAVVSPIATTIYTVHVKSHGGCVATGTVTVTVN
jgi:hypothetical protein